MYFATWKPAADIFFSGNQWLIRMELAGVSPAEVQVVTHGKELTVRGRRRDLRVQHGYICHALEISYSHFERSIALPSRIAPSSIRLEFQEGILNIYLTTDNYQ